MIDEFSGFSRTVEITQAVEVMGLALVETVMRIETEFEITIPDEFSEKMTTPRRIIDYLINQKSINEKRSREAAALKVWEIIEYEGGFDVEEFKIEDSRFIEDMEMD